MCKLKTSKTFLRLSCKLTHTLIICLKMIAAFLHCCFGQIWNFRAIQHSICHSCSSSTKKYCFQRYKNLDYTQVSKLRGFKCIILGFRVPIWFILISLIQHGFYKIFHKPCFYCRCTAYNTIAFTTRMRVIIKKDIMIHFVYVPNN